MKTAFLLAMVLLSVVDWSSASPDHKACSDSSDCDEDECCWGINSQQTQCCKLGNEGDDCLTNITICETVCLKCPCGPDYRCVPKNNASNDGTCERFL